MGHEPPPFTLLLGLEIGCSIVMGGLVLQEEQHRPPLPIAGGHGRNNSRGRGIGGTMETASTVDGRDAGVRFTAKGMTKPQTLQPVAPPALPTATPERRRLAPTDFVTPSSPPALTAVPPHGDDDDGGEQDDGESGNLPLAVGVPDPVLAKIVRDFDHGGKDYPLGGCASSSSPPFFKPPPQAARGSASDGASAENAGVSPSATEYGNGGGSGVIGPDEGRPATADAVNAVEPAKAERRGEDFVSPGLKVNAGCLASPSESGAAGWGGEDTGERLEGFRGGVGAGGGSSESGGGKAGGGADVLEKTPRVALPTKDEEVDVPDGEWRRYGTGEGIQRKYHTTVARQPLRRANLLCCVFCLSPPLSWLQHQYLLVALFCTAFSSASTLY